MVGKVITFNKNARKDILEFFDKTVDDEGFIVESSDPEQRVITPEGDEVEFLEFAGLTKGSEIFIKSDLISLIKLADKLK